MSAFILNVDLCPLFVTAMWSHPEELPELPHQTQNRNHFSLRHHYGTLLHSPA